MFCFSRIGEGFFCGFFRSGKFCEFWVFLNHGSKFRIRIGCDLASSIKICFPWNSKQFSSIMWVETNSSTVKSLDFFCFFSHLYICVVCLTKIFICFNSKKILDVFIGNVFNVYFLSFNFLSFVIYFFRLSIIFRVLLRCTVWWWLWFLF